MRNTIYPAPVYSDSPIRGPNRLYDFDSPDSPQSIGNIMQVGVTHVTPGTDANGTPLGATFTDVPMPYKNCTQWLVLLAAIGNTTYANLIGLFTLQLFLEGNPVTSPIAVGYTIELPQFAPVGATTYQFLGGVAPPPASAMLTINFDSVRITQPAIPANAPVFAFSMRAMIATGDAKISPYAGQFVA